MRGRLSTISSILILSLIFAISGTAQNWKRPVAITLYQIGTVAVGSLGDAYNDNGKKTLGHSLKALEVAALVSGPMLFKIGRGEYAPYIATYVGWRIVGYDYMYNAGAGRRWDDLGNSSRWDKTLNQYPTHGVTFARGVVLMATISFPIKYL